jgi:OOP family OmpA-OmpF porin
VALFAASCCSVSGCGGPTVFAGASAFAISGTPPPAPPPAPPPPKVVLKEKAIEINEKIQFDVDKAIIKEVSFGLLDEVAKVIREHPELRKISIEGHASSEGGDAHNLDLSDRRAKAVMEYLVTKASIEKERLQARGFGSTLPLASNDYEEGREKNRRVEFNIIERDPATPAPAAGNPPKK